MIAGFYDPERITHAAERAYALEFLDHDDSISDPYLKGFGGFKGTRLASQKGKLALAGYIGGELWSLIRLCFQSWRVKSNAALATHNARGFARRAIDQLSEFHDIDERTLARMLLTDNYSRWVSIFRAAQASPPENPFNCHEDASKPKYRRAFQLARNLMNS
ncbi:hypothetical protein GF386_01700 [Candidatus Pacearchaeota archaeon]|nr:hypothetical protein [Candidatus Pacearchaeota archaeon]